MSISEDLAESVLTDLNIAEDVLSGLEDKAEKFGRLMPEHVEKLDQIKPDLERAKAVAIEAENDHLKRRVAGALDNIDFLTGDKMKSSTQEKEKQNLKWAKERIVEAQEAI